MILAQLDGLWTYVGYKSEKKGFRKKTNSEYSGGGRFSPRY